MAHLLTSWIDKVAEVGESFAEFTLEEQESIGPRIASEILHLERAMASIQSKTVIRDAVIESVLVESFHSLLAPGVEANTLLVPSPEETHTLRCVAWVNAHQAAFILFLSNSVPYNKNPLLPRVVHEACHIESSILPLIVDNRIRIRWLGEVLCDVAALLLCGPAFLIAGNALMEFVGHSRATTPDSRHPSLAGRKAILASVAAHTWSPRLVEAVVGQILAKTAAFKCGYAEAIEQQSLARQVQSRLPRYTRLDMNSGTWERVYLEGQRDNRGSHLVQMNVDIVERGLSK